MKILQLFDATYPQISGYSMRSKYITDELKGMGYELLVYSSPTYPYTNRTEYHNGVKYRHIKSKLYSVVKGIPVIRELVVVCINVFVLLNEWDESVKLIDAHSSVLNGVSAGIIKSIKRIPFVYEIRAFWEDAAVDLGKTNESSYRYKITRGIETFVAKNADCVTVICNGLKNDLVERGISSDKIHIIKNGVDMDKFQPLEKDFTLLNDIGLSKGDCVIGFIGTFFEFEGLRLLIESLPILLNSISNIKVVLVGGGRTEEILKEMVDRNNLNNSVRFAGRVPHEEINRYYSVLDVVVYPRISKRITELVTPLKPLEAMALKKCVLASDVGGLKELIIDGKTGVLFKAGDKEDLAKKCIQLLQDAEKRKEIQNNALRYVKEERQWKSICDEYRLIFTALEE